jgi:hypothetical protein
MGLCTKGHLDSTRSIRGGIETLLGSPYWILNGQFARKRLKRGWKMGISMTSNSRDAGWRILENLLSRHRISVNRLEELRRVLDKNF